jgi:hypothetical protein
MRKTIYYCFAAGLIAFCSAAQATTFTFNTDPFAGTPVLTAPGRQIVGGEEFISFNTATDTFVLDAATFGVSGPVHFVNTTAGNIPTTGVNVVVLETFDNDANPLTPFGAGQAADLIADRITTPGPGFFVYFNQSLNLPRLVYSTDLSSSDADLKILARMLNLFGAEGMNAMPTFTERNFEITTATNAPEPSTLFMLTGAAMIVACRYARKKLKR